MSDYVEDFADFEYDRKSETYYYPCPCGGRFELTKKDLNKMKDDPFGAFGEVVATCPSCSKVVKVDLNLEDFQHAEEEKVAKSEKTKLEVAS